MDADQQVGRPSDTRDKHLGTPADYLVTIRYSIAQIEGHGLNLRRVWQPLQTVEVRGEEPPIHKRSTDRRVRSNLSVLPEKDREVGCPKATRDTRPSKRARPSPLPEQCVMSHADPLGHELRTAGLRDDPPESLRLVR
ncbi:hypothetical protein [Actinophytocola glycyrrhizae]|uniref:Uncharacterized protein n=1 Tax=Actinophytocola glycyrrhizae TaxID=2044873 RepID=A0ABV9SIP2_9PSEU